MHSHAVPAEELEASGCFTILPVRRSNIWKALEDVASSTQRDWRQKVGDDTPSDFHGTANPISGSWDSVVLPGSIPERLKLITRMTQTLFLIDDKADRLPRAEAHGLLNQDLVNVFDEKSMWDAEATSIQSVITPVFQGMITLDRKRAQPILSEWQKWFKQTDSLGGEDFRTLEDYLTHRTINVAWHPYCRAVIFGMELHLTPEEIRSTSQFGECASRSYALTNDWWSWAKERKALETDAVNMMSAVPIIMRLESVMEHEALERVKSLISVYEHDLLRKRDLLLVQPGITEDLKTYVHALVHMCSGNSMWSSTTVRYKV